MRHRNSHGCYLHSNRGGGGGGVSGGNVPIVRAGGGGSGANVPFLGLAEVVRVSVTLDSVLLRGTKSSPMSLVLEELLG